MKAEADSYFIVWTQLGDSEEDNWAQAMTQKLESVKASN
jgi:hypothetical protein